MKENFAFCCVRKIPLRKGDICNVLSEDVPVVWGSSFFFFFEKVFQSAGMFAGYNKCDPRKNTFLETESLYGFCPTKALGWKELCMEGAASLHSENVKRLERGHRCLSESSPRGTM